VKRAVRRASGECRRVRVTVEGYGVIEACQGDNLGRILARHGLLPLPCGGHGLCGLCRVAVEGEVSPPTANELMHGLRGGERLACQVTVLGNVRVRLLRKPSEVAVRASLYSALVNPPSVEPIASPVERVPAPEKPVVVLGGVGSAGVLLDVAGELILPSRGRPELALLVDVGTTKIAYQLVDSNGRIRGEGVEFNPLNAYGADVVTRLSRAVEEPQSLAEMSGRLRDTLAGLARRFQPGLVLAAGNSVNTSILLGLPVETLAEKPFQPVARGPFVTVVDGYPTILAPLIGGFVGGDAYAVLVASLAMNLPRPYLVIDIGTNTETLLVTDDAVYATSTPAGPAFEGHLESGSAAPLGGITKVRFAGFDSNGSARFTYESVGEPSGLLGTGVISLVAELVRHGLAGRNGRFLRGYRRVNGVKAFTIEESHGVVFTQRDMREFQKAYAAVKTSWRMLLREAELSPSDLKLVIIAGTFGSSIDRRDLIELGLVPTCEESKLAYGGNLVLSGLRVMWLSREYFTMWRSLLKRIQHINLAEHPDYTRVWVESLELKSACGGE
jgi:uncharacterized 2Fe-2S/4Fe-4S cluster protein (DUF4445 family)